MITPAVHGEGRGYIMETYNEKDMKEAGIDVRFVQDNQPMSVKDVLRGLHFQKQYPRKEYALKNGAKLILSDKDQKWMGLKDTFKF